MATSYPKSTQALLTTSITIFLLLLNKVNSSNDISFTFNKFVPNQQDLIFQGDASVSPTGSLHVTKVKEGKPVFYSVGRALYEAPIHIWDNATGKEASFATSFTFVVKAPDATKTADGFAFFLTTPDSQIPPGRSTGGRLGLVNNISHNISNAIVAVEFDTYYNAWDPSYRHIGIDVNSIESKKTVAWDWRNGEVAVVLISYIAPTKTLTASLTYPSSQTSFIVTASVDLKSALPEWVRVGFSGATGETEDYIETHDVLSWSFTSALETNSKSYSVMENNLRLGRYTA